MLKRYTEHYISTGVSKRYCELAFVKLSSDYGAKGAQVLNTELNSLKSVKSAIMNDWC